MLSLLFIVLLCKGNKEIKQEILQIQSDIYETGLNLKEITAQHLVSIFGTFFLFFSDWI